MENQFKDAKVVKKEKPEIELPSEFECCFCSSDVSIRKSRSQQWIPNFNSICVGCRFTMISYRFSIPPFIGSFTKLHFQFIKYAYRIF